MGVLVAVAVAVAVAVTGQENRRQAAWAQQSAAAVLYEPARGRGPVPRVFGLRVAGVPGAGVLPEHRAGTGAGA